MLKEYRDVLKVKDLCEILGLSKNMVYNLLKSNTIRSLKTGRKYLIPKQCVIDYLESAQYTSC